jgi:hypothetical protein
VVVAPEVVVVDGFGAVVVCDDPDVVVVLGGCAVVDD